MPLLQTPSFIKHAPPYTQTHGSSGQPYITFKSPPPPAVSLASITQRKKKKHTTHTNGISMTKFNDREGLPSLLTSGDLKNGFLQETSQLPWQYSRRTRTGNESASSISADGPLGASRRRSDTYRLSDVERCSQEAGGSTASLCRGLSWSHLFPLFSCRVAKLTNTNKKG